uniref:PB2 n=1 Tax=Wenling hagfish influenza virus TaxID=2116481 RepID=A0A2P1GNM9_9ORTO|nr:PB2 [Wenling hagfish influenza virus]
MDDLLRIKGILEQDDLREILQRQPSSSVSVLKKMASTMKDHEPGLRTRMAFRRAFGVIGRADMLPETFVDIKLRPNERDKEHAKNDLDINTCKLLAPPAVNYWNLTPWDPTHGSHEKAEADVDLKLRGMSLEISTWNRALNSNFGPVSWGRQKQMRMNAEVKVRKHNLTRTGAQKVALSLVYPAEVTGNDLLNREETAVAQALASEIPETVGCRSLQAAMIVEKHSTAVKRCIPMSHRMPPEEIEMLHMLEGRNFRQEVNVPVAQDRQIGRVTIKRLSMFLVTRALADPNPLPFLMEAIESTTVDGQPFASCLRRFTSGHDDCSICTAAVGLGIPNVYRSGALMLYKVSTTVCQQGTKRYSDGALNERVVTVWSGQEDFFWESRDTSGALTRNKTRLHALSMKATSPLNAVKAFLEALLFVRDDRLYDIPDLDHIWQREMDYTHEMRMVVNRNVERAFKSVCDKAGIQTLVSPLHDARRKMGEMCRLRIVADDVDFTETQTTTKYNIDSATLDVTSSFNGFLLARHKEDLTIKPDEPHKVMINMTEVWRHGTDEECARHCAQALFNKVPEIKSLIASGNIEKLIGWQEVRYLAARVPRARADLSAASAVEYLRRMKLSGQVSGTEAIKALFFAGNPLGRKRRANEDRRNHIWGNGDSIVFGANSRMFTVSPDGSVWVAQSKMVMPVGAGDPGGRIADFGLALMEGCSITATPFTGKPTLTAEGVIEMAPGEKCNFILGSARKVGVVKNKVRRQPWKDAKETIKRQRLREGAY